MNFIPALIAEIKKIGALTLFFLICFGYILILKKLFLDAYSIEFSALGKATVGALFAAKAVLILEKTSLLNRFRQSPRYINVLYKTLLYTLAVLFIGMLEELIHAYSKTRAMPSAIETALQSSNLNHFLAVNLCLVVVFLLYNVFTEIDTYMGKGTLRKLFFSPTLP